MDKLLSDSAVLSPTTRTKILLNGGIGLSNPGPI